MPPHISTLFSPKREKQRNVSYHRNPSWNGTTKNDGKKRATISCIVCRKKAGSRNFSILCLTLEKIKWKLRITHTHTSTHSHTLRKLAFGYLFPSIFGMVLLVWLRNCISSLSVHSPFTIATFDVWNIAISNIKISYAKNECVLRI